MKPHESCGIVGVYGTSDASTRAFRALSAVQHRGEESAGICSVNEGCLSCSIGDGLVKQAIKPSDLATHAGSRLAIAHTRYSTTGGTGIQNAQPLLADCRHGQIALAHNGNLINTDTLRERLIRGGCSFRTSTDSEVMLQLIALSEGTVLDGIKAMMNQVSGAYSLVIMTGTSLIAIRDPNGFRPLCLGRIGEGYVVASETCALDAIGATLIQDIAPGEIITIDSYGIRSEMTRASDAGPYSFCVFEYVYFARPDSFIKGVSVGARRIWMGQILAREHPLNVDMVVPIPDSGTLVATGYASSLHLSLVPAFIRSHYHGRSFLLPDNEKRLDAVNGKLSLIADLVRGKRVAVVDDSIVRGNTARRRIEMLKNAGAKEVHMLVSCPAHRHPCVFGVDFPTREELIAHGKSTEEIALELGLDPRLDSLHYLSEQGLREAVGGGDNLCFACYNGRYRI